MTGGPGRLTFPADFVWGAATASFQIEGGAREGGRTDSIWDTFCRVPGAVAGGDDGDVACDHYHRWPQDVALMGDLHLNAYRFSISWPRIVPAPGRINAEGLDFYSRLVDGLLERGITPWATLYHWDLPQWSQDGGGWASRDVVDQFVEYTQAVHGALGDRVHHWITLNEPWCAANLGYGGGQHAPGRQVPQEAVDATHHLLLAHGEAARLIRSADPAAVIGLTVNTTVADPADPSDPADVTAARLNEVLFSLVFVEPALLGTYPVEAVEAFAAAGCTLPIHEGDLERIAAPLDFLGLNYYHGSAISSRRPSADRLLEQAPGATRPTSDPSPGPASYQVVRGLPRTAMGWEVQPDGLRRLLTRMHHDYTGPAGMFLAITENGAAFDDVVEPDGSVLDHDRTSYYVEHLAALHAAIDDGIDVRAYFAWSLLDNFEWAYGYGKRFGIVRVDFDTQERTPKLSALTLAEVARTGTLRHAESAPVSESGPASVASAAHARAEGTVRP